MFCVYFVTKKQRNTNLKDRLYFHLRKKFVSKLHEGNKNAADLINKIANYTHQKVYCHHICELNFSYAASLNKNTTRSNWHDLREHHKVVFDEMCEFIRDNIIEKEKYIF